MGVDTQQAHTVETGSPRTLGDQSTTAKKPISQNNKNVTQTSIALSPIGSQTPEWIIELNDSTAKIFLKEYQENLRRLIRLEQQKDLAKKIDSQYLLALPLALNTRSVAETLRDRIDANQHSLQIIAFNQTLFDRQRSVVINQPNLTYKNVETLVNDAKKLSVEYPSVRAKRSVSEKNRRLEARYLLHLETYNKESFARTDAIRKLNNPSLFHWIYKKWNQLKTFVSDIVFNLTKTQNNNVSAKNAEKHAKEEVEPTERARSSSITSSKTAVTEVGAFHRQPLGTPRNQSLNGTAQPPTPPHYVNLGSGVNDVSTSLKQPPLTRENLAALNRGTIPISKNPHALYSTGSRASSSVVSSVKTDPGYRGGTIPAY